MSIGKRISEAIDKMQASDPEGALFAVCAAIEVTAKKEFDEIGSISYKKFINENTGLITKITFGNKSILNIRLGYSHPNIKESKDGTCSIVEIFYHVIRCGLYHETKIPDDIKFIDEQIIEIKNGIIFLPANFIYGLIIAVIISPMNKDEITQKDKLISLRGLPLALNKLWGHKNEFLWIMDMISEVIRIQARPSAESEKQSTSPQ